MLRVRLQTAPEIPQTQLAKLRYRAKTKSQESRRLRREDEHMTLTVPDAG